MSDPDATKLDWQNELPNTGPYTLPPNPIPQATGYDPTWTHTMTADQQIRAEALDATVRLHMAERGWEPHNSSAFWKCLLEFERYIREGK